MRRQVGGAGARAELFHEPRARLRAHVGEARGQLAAPHGGDGRSERGHAERRADHARHVEDPRRHPGVRAVDGVHRGGAHRRHDEADAEAHEHEAHDEEAVARVRGDPGHPEHRGGHGDQAAGHEPARADAVGQPAGEGPGKHHHDRSRQEAHAGLKRGEAQDVLHVQGQREEVGEHHEGDDESDDVGAEVRARAEEAEVDDRRATARLDHQERRQRREREREQADHARGAPAPRVALHERDHERGEAQRERRHARDVDLADGRLIARLARGEQRHRDRPDRDGDVEDEDRLPAHFLHEQPAHDRPDRERHRRDPRPRADRAPALVRVERVRDDREGRRHHEAGPDALHRAEGDQPGVAPRQRDQEAREPEHRHAEQEHAPAPEQVAEAPARHQHHRERERVGVDRPLERGRARVQAALDRRQRDVHDRVVEHDHEQADRHCNERPPLAVLRREQSSSHPGERLEHHTRPFEVWLPVRFARDGVHLEPEPRGRRERERDQARAPTRRGGLRRPAPDLGRGTGALLARGDRGSRARVLRALGTRLGHVARH